MRCIMGIGNIYFVFIRIFLFYLFALLTRSLISFAKLFGLMAFCDINENIIMDVSYEKLIITEDSF
jgi:hypothetical protein